MEKFDVLKLAERILDEEAAYRFLEDLRWNGTPVCPHCGSIAAHYFLRPQGEGRRTRTGAISVRRVWKCKDCRKQFSVLTGTIFHGTKIPVRTWVFVVFEMCASKNGVAARELERRYGLSPKSAWFMTHRIREAMKRGPLSALLRGTIVADETYMGGDPKNLHAKQREERRKRGRGADKVPVLSLVHRESGTVHSQVIPRVDGRTIRKAITDHVDPKGSVLHSDAWIGYMRVAPEFDGHGVVDHSKGTYVTPTGATTNHVEGFFSQLKRSVDGTYHHVSVEHLPRYLAEFDFRYSTRHLNDTERVARLMGQVPGRRLYYERET